MAKQYLYVRVINIRKSTATILCSFCNCIRHNKIFIAAFAFCKNKYRLENRCDNYTLISIHIFLLVKCAYSFWRTRYIIIIETFYVSTSKLFHDNNRLDNGTLLITLIIKCNDFLIIIITYFFLSTTHIHTYRK